MLVYTGFIFIYRLSVPKLLVVNEEIILVWHTAVVSTLTHLLETSTEVFVSTLHLIRCAWVGFQVGTGRAESAWNSMTAADEAGQAAGSVGCCRRMECQFLTNRS